MKCNNMYIFIAVSIFFVASVSLSFASIADLYYYSPTVLLNELPLSLRERYENYQTLKIPEHIEWLNDYYSAIQLARDERKDIFMVFCRENYEPCKNIFKLLRTNELKKFLSQFVCLKVREDELDIWNLYFRPPSGTIIIMDWRWRVYFDSHMGMEFWNQPIYDKLPIDLESEYKSLCVKLVKWKIPIGMHKKDVMKKIGKYNITKNFINENGTVYCIFDGSGNKYEVPRSYKTDKQICATAGWTFKPITVKHEMIVCFLPGLICGGATYIYFNEDNQVVDIFQGGT